jgi:DNA-binding XRE family transcriptional regulator
MTDDLSDLAAQRVAAEERWRNALKAAYLPLVWQLKDRRTALGMTQEQVAARVGVSRAQIANAETGSMLSVEALIGYAVAVGAQLTIVDRPPKGE